MTLAFRFRTPSHPAIRFARRIEMERIALSDPTKEVRNLLTQTATIRAKASPALARKLSAFEEAIKAETELEAAASEWEDRRRQR